MDHRSLIASLAPEERVRLNRKSTPRGLAHLALHWSAIAAVAALIALRVPLWPLLLPVQGVLIIFLFTLLHETIHRTVFEARWLNDAVARACGFLLLLPADWFRYFHLAHHRHTQDPLNDPELASPKPANPGAYVLHVSGLPVWRGEIATLIRNARGLCDDAYVPAAGHAKVTREARAMLAGYGLVAAACAGLGTAEPLWLWVVPAILGQPFLRLYLLAEHGRCPLVANMLENSRTTFTNRLVRLLAWNMPYHAEHHACPTVPFHRLPDLHALTREHLRTTERGYARFHRRYLSELDGRG